MLARTQVVYWEDHLQYYINLRKEKLKDEDESKRYKEKQHKTEENKKYEESEEKKEEERSYNVNTNLANEYQYAQVLGLKGKVSKADIKKHIVNL
jgi:hypothetical protein